MKVGCVRMCLDRASESRKGIRYGAIFHKFMLYVRVIVSVPNTSLLCGSGPLADWPYGHLGMPGGPVGLKTIGPVAR